MKVEPLPKPRASNSQSVKRDNLLHLLKSTRDKEIPKIRIDERGTTSVTQEMYTPRKHLKTGDFGLPSERR